MRRAPGRCAHCNQTRTLVCADDQGARVCGPCSGDGRDHACRQCGRTALSHADRRCPTCVVTERFTNLFTGPDGVVPTQLRGLHQLLLTENPARAQLWLYHTKWSRLLETLIAGGQPLTHELLDVLAGQHQSVRHLRQALIHAGALPQRDEPLAAVERWLDTPLTGIPAHHAALIRPYASWSVLHRARRRARQRGATASAGRYARSRIRAALKFLAWLDSRNVAFVDATQNDVEQWLDAGSSSRYRLRDFLRWADGRRLCRHIVVPALGCQGLAEHTLPADQRWALLRRCLTDEQLSTPLRVAGSLVLLYGQTPTRIFTLTQQDVMRLDGMTYITLHRQPVLMPGWPTWSASSASPAPRTGDRSDPAEPFHPGCSPAHTLAHTKRPDISARRSMNSSDWRFVPAAAPRCAT